MNLLKEHNKLACRMQAITLHYITLKLFRVTKYKTAKLLLFTV